jgi:hypothetical protein
VSALLTFVCPPAGATVVKALDVETLARNAELIVRGKALDSTAAWGGGRKLIHTVTRVKVDGLLKGTVPGGVVEVRTPGGTVGEISQRVSGAAQLAAGEEVVLFLKKIPGPRARFAVEGFSQGKFTLSRVEGRTLVTRELPGLSVVDASGKPRAAPSFQPQPESEFVERVRRALGERTTP